MRHALNTTAAFIIYQLIASAAILYGSLSRLIPAHAGKTRKHPRGYSGNAAHPRSRGENWTSRT